MNENMTTCKRIAEELEKIYNNELFVIEEGSTEYFENYEEVENESGDTCYKILDGYYEGDIVEDEPVAFDLYNYFNNALDIEYTIGSDKSFRGVRIMVTCGGPNIYINTISKQVELYWWGSSDNCYISSEVCEEINSIFEELYNCL